jgi:polar amino acid transport system permease protein
VERFLSSFFDAEVALGHWRALAEGFGVTVALAAAVIATGVALGILLAALRAHGFRAANALVVAAVDVLRAVPPLATLVVVYFGLPFVGLTLPGWAAAWITLALILAAFEEEVVYGGIAAVPRGQWDAARALGLGFTRALALVALPQALRMTLAPMTSRAIAIAKSTALASVIAVPELLNRATSAQAASANTTPLTVAAAGYVLMFLPLVFASRWLERRYPTQRATGA